MLLSCLVYCGRRSYSPRNSSRSGRSRRSFIRPLARFKRAILQLNEVFSADDLGLGFHAQVETYGDQCTNHALAVQRRLCGKNDHVLRGAWESEQDGAAPPNEEVLHTRRVERCRHFLSLQRIEGSRSLIQVARVGNRGTLASGSCTSRDTLAWSRTSGRPACPVPVDAHG